MTDYTARIKQLAGWFYTRLIAARYSHNKIIDGSVPCLWQTPEGVLYWHEYVPMRISNLSENDKQVRARLFSLKKGRYTMFFAKELANALQILSQKEHCTHFALIRVPRSTVGLETGLAESIKTLSNTVLNGITVSNYSNYLVRTKDIIPQHLTDGRTPPHILKNSLALTLSLTSLPSLSSISYLFVLIDDIVTSGRTLLVCRDILIESGIQPAQIRMMAIARTVYRGENSYPRTCGVPYH